MVENTSPLALYIEQVNNYEPMSPPSHPKVTVYPPSPPSNLIFNSLHSAPNLVKGQTNRVLAYVGSFNPPHRGHLHLLKHVFTRGTHDMNVVAAIVIPMTDEGVSAKVQAEDGNFMFGIEERCLLWKQDPRLPPWAWVYENGFRAFTIFSERLIQESKKDGYQLEFVPLCGAGDASPSSTPRPRFGCKTTIISDAARAADYQLSSGRLENFDEYTRWKRVHVDKDKLRCCADRKVRHALEVTKDMGSQEARSMPEDGPCHVNSDLATTLAKQIEDMKAVLECQNLVEDRGLTLRFVECEDVDPRADHNDISSTELREVMRTNSGVELKKALDRMALSARLLWRCRASWMEKARLGTGLCIKFQGLTEKHLLPEESTSDEEPASCENPPSLE